MTTKGNEEKMKKHRRGSAHLRRTWSILASCVALALALAIPVSANAALDITAFDGAVSANEAGDPYTQAGGHPYEVSTWIEWATTTAPNGTIVPAEDPKLIDVILPPGLVGNPAATPRCAIEDFSRGDGATTACPISTKIGTAILSLKGSPLLTPVPVYNLVAPPDKPALFGFFFLVQPVLMDGRVSRADGEYRIHVRSPDISQGLPLTAFELNLWGTPADPSHDALRGGPSTGPLVPFLTLPTACTAPGVGLETNLKANSWQDPNAFDTTSFISHLPPNHPLPPADWGASQGPTGCENVPFDVDARLDVTSENSDSPSALEFGLTVPQEGLVSPKGIAPSHVKSVKVTFPKGMAVNPASAAGLDSCTPAQIQLSSEADPTCPDAARLGEIEVETPLLDEPVRGHVYLAQQGSNPFDSTLAVYLVAKGPGLLLKLPGKVSPDRVDGQLVAEFDNNPQLPFSDLRVEFWGGSKAPLVTPPTCGTYQVMTEVTPWARPAEKDVSTSEFTIDHGPGGGPCLAGDPNRPGSASDLGSRPFDIGLQGGLLNATAGSSSPFLLQLTRRDGHQEISSFEVDLPPGLTAKLAGIPYCSDAALASVSGAEGSGAAQLAAPSCPAASQVGTAIVGAGAGADPFQVKTGKAYLAGPYKGAPLSLAVVTPAVAGPFDLGSVLIRSAVEIDRDDAQVHVTTDPLPQTLYGIPLRLRDIQVLMDRPGFMRAPTNCSEMKLAAQVTSAFGAVSSKAQRFQVGDCAALDFKPKLSLRLKGKTKRTGHPALTAVLTQPTDGQANIGRVSVVLPRAQFIDQSRIGNVCTRPQFAADACPANSVLGQATAYTPLLDQPLTGTVYLRANGGERELPDMVAALRGQIDVDLVGYIDSVPVPRDPDAARIRNTFAIVPDAPVSKFVLKLNAGKKALLVNSQNLCRSPQRAKVKMAGQNGKVHNFNPLLKNDCGGKRAKGKR